MTPREICRTQFARLAGLPGYPDVAEAKTAALDALVNFHNEHRLTLWIDDALREFYWCPKPTDIYSAAAASRPPRVNRWCGVKDERGVLLCHDGWRYVRRNGEVVGVVPCECRRAG